MNGTVKAADRRKSGTAAQPNYTVGIFHSNTRRKKNGRKNSGNLKRAFWKRSGQLHKERNLTVILVSHSMEDVARYVERLIVMNHGTVAFDATPGEVFSHYKELEKIGLMAPQVTYVMEGLARRGVTLPHNAITVQEAVDSILQAR